jgi:endoglucanase
MFTRIRVCLLLVLISAPSLSGADFAMKVTDKNYLDTRGFSVFLYDSMYHPVFVDQKNTAMEMILHGQRIATNGDVRLMPTPEQWDLVATLKGRQADKANSRLTADSPPTSLSRRSTSVTHWKWQRSQAAWRSASISTSR